MKAAISGQTLHFLANSYLGAKAWDVVDLPLISANCLQSYLSGFSCWSRGEPVAQVLPTSCQWKRGCRFPCLSSCGQSTAFLQLSGGLLALYGIIVVACTYPSIYCEKLTELQSIPGAAFKVLPK